MRTAVSPAHGANFARGRRPAEGGPHGSVTVRGGGGFGETAGGLPSQRQVHRVRAREADGAGPDDSARGGGFGLARGGPKWMKPAQSRF
jgi:hypothetical protein